MKEDMKTLIDLTKKMANELHTTNKIAVSGSLVNVITLVVIAWGLMR